MRHITRTATSALLVGGILTVLAGCGGGDDEPVADPVEQPAAAAIDYGLVSVDEAMELAARDGVTVIDVRTPQEFAEGHLDGALLIDLSSAGFADEVAALDPAGEYLVYCRSGNRSAQAVAIMQQLGFERLWDLDGGVIAIADAGYPLVR